MPLAANKVADELEQVCSSNNCKNLENWLNELYLFKKEYEIYTGKIQ